jgi:uncharacterized membrane protein HdeD (DUF308 family)
MTNSSTTDADAPGRGWFLAIGVVLAGLGLIALWNAVDATVVTTIFIGWLLVLAGIANVMGAFTSNGGVGWRLVHGVLGALYVVVGLNVVFDPLSGAIALVIVFGAMLITDGILSLVAAFMDRASDAAWIVVLAIVDILLGLWLWTGIPFSGIAIGLFVGIQLVVAGVTWILAGILAGQGMEKPAGA